MLIHIDPQCSDPIFEQITYQVKGAAARGELQEGEKLPSVREMARDLSVNPNTIVRAYEVLEGEGVILRRKGAGCFATGRTSALNETTRRRLLGELMQRAATECHHLGFLPGAIRGALDEELDGIRFENKGENVS